jgi:hypothetical protein
MRPSCEYLMSHEVFQGWTDTQKYFSASLDQKDSILCLDGGNIYNMTAKPHAWVATNAVQIVTDMTALLCSANFC